MWQIVLQNATAILMQNAAEAYKMRRGDYLTNSDNFITKCDSYYKMPRLLQMATLQGAATSKTF